MTLNELRESIEDLLDALPEAADMRVCFFDQAAQQSYSLWEPELKYLNKDTRYGDEALYDSLEELEAEDLSVDDTEQIVVL